MEAVTLYEKERPSCLADIVGQQEAVAKIKRLVEPALGGQSMVDFGSEWYGQDDTGADPGPNGGRGLSCVVRGGAQMLALSIRQPWAWLVVHGFKDIENRTWRSEPRGRIWIHASRTLDRAGCAWVWRHFPEIILPDEFEMGGLIGSVVHDGCVAENASPWFTGPWGHVLRDPKPCRFRSCPGRLWFFDPEKTLA